MNNNSKYSLDGSYTSQTFNDAYPFKENFTDDGIQLIYQNAELAFDFESEIIYATTTLWFMTANEVIPNSMIHLNCRQCRITEILVNGIPAEHVYNDALKNFATSIQSNSDGGNSTATSNSYCACELDKNYRGALELSNSFELRIKIPSNENRHQNNYIFGPIKKLPGGVSKDINSRCEQLNAILNQLKPNLNSIPMNNNSTVKSTEDDKLLESIMNQSIRQDNGRMLQVKISYTLKKGNVTGGYIFRHQQKYNDGYGGTYGGLNSKPVCVYSTSGARQNHSLLNFDGVRCWLPCLDGLEHRCVYDITLHVPSNMHLVLCTGSSISKSTSTINIAKLGKLVGHNSSSTNSRVTTASSYIKYTSIRYFSINRINANSIGFFVGNGESYQMPLFNCRGKFSVALDILDYQSSSKSRSLKNENDVRIINVENCNIKNGKTISSKRDRGDFELDNEQIDDRRLYEHLVHHSTLGFDLTTKFVHKFIGKRYHHDSYSQVYIPNGLGIGSNCDFISFDGFSLVDAKYLHNDKQNLIESPHQLLILNAYLYSYIPNVIFCHTYLNEYLLHGIMGYLVQVYISAIYGETESMYHILKSRDTVTKLEKLYQNFLWPSSLPPIASIRYPEAYEVFQPWYGVYMINKSLLIFHIIENHLGGNESIRRSFNQLIHAPSINKSKMSNPNDYIPATKPIVNQTEAIISTNMPKEVETTLMPYASPSPYDSIATPSHFNAYSKLFQKGSPIVVVGDQTIDSPSYSIESYQDSTKDISSPILYASDSDDIHMKDLKLYGGVSMSPATYAALDTRSPSYGYSSPSLSGNDSPPRELHGLYEFYQLQRKNDLTGELFIELIKNAAGVSCNVNDNILNLLAYSNSTFRGRMDLLLDPKIEGRSRNLHLILDSAPLFQQHSNSYSTQKWNIQFYDSNVTCRVVEVRDDRVSEISLNIPPPPITATVIPGSSIYVVEHTQQLFTKPGRRAGSVYRKEKKAEGEAETTTNSLIASNNEESEKILLESRRPFECLSSGILSKLHQHFMKFPTLFKEDWLYPSKELDYNNHLTRQDVMKIIEKLNYPLRYCLFDPGNMNLSDIDTSCLPDVLLIQQLFLELDSFDLFRQVQALRALSRSITSRIRTHRSAQPVIIGQDKVLSLQFHAIVDSLLGIVSKPKSGLFIQSQSKSPHSLYVRIEAAFALVQWQFERSFNHHHQSIMSSNSILDYVQGTNSTSSINEGWEGAFILVKFLCDLFLDPQSGKSRVYDMTDEWFIVFRYGILSAVSNIKTREGITPIEIVEVLIHIYEQESLLYEKLQKLQVAMDSIHNEAMIILALSRCVMDNVTRETNLVLLHKIVNLIVHRLGDIFATCKTTTFMNHKIHQRNLMFTLPYDGLLPASCLTCLGEMDRQAIVKYHNFTSPKLYPSTVGLASYVDYAMFFLPNGIILQNSIRESIRVDESSHTHSGFRIKIKYDSPLNTPLLRSAALEAYIRICFTLFEKFVSYSKDVNTRKDLAMKAERLEGSQSTTQTTTSKSSQMIRENRYLQAAVEAMIAVVTHDSDMTVRQNAIQSFLDAYLDSPSRVVISAISLGNKLLTFGYSDASATTLLDMYKVNYRTFGAKEYNQQQQNIYGLRKILPNATTNVRKGLYQYAQVSLRKELQKWWKAIIHSVYDQTSRSLLLNLWICIFHDKVPKALEAIATPIESNKDCVFDGSLPTPSFRDPIEMFIFYDVYLRSGSGLDPRSIICPSSGVASSVSTKAKPVARAVAVPKPVPVASTIERISLSKTVNKVIIEKEHELQSQKAPATVDVPVRAISSSSSSAIGTQSSDVNPSTSQGGGLKLKLTLKRSVDA